MIARVGRLGDPHNPRLSDWVSRTTPRQVHRIALPTAPDARCPMCWRMARSGLVRIVAGETVSTAACWPAPQHLVREGCFASTVEYIMVT